MIHRPTTDATASAITIRRAIEADLPRMAAMLYHDPPTEMKGVVPDLSKARKIGKLLLRYRLEAGVERTQLAVIDGEAVGLLETMRPGDRSNISPLSIPAVLARGMLIVGPQRLQRV